MATVIDAPAPRLHRETAWSFAVGFALMVAFLIAA